MSSANRARSGEVRTGAVGHCRDWRIRANRARDPVEPADGDGMHGHTKIASDDRGFLGVKRIGNSGFVVAVGEQDKDLLLGSGISQGIEPQGNGIADIGTVLARLGGGTTRTWSRSHE